ncbi:uncharacterized protein LOC128745500 [Sabethes cyaneus]|uniref:uncharacterized protein LOC128745500 n=1 Tax=Sabethes cyaneus TaxID=53552 RepID=UPI00237E4CF8|nr:uncharacterized protein LOC128745500 [Sabethes cyaneus]
MTYNINGMSKSYPVVMRGCFQQQQQMEESRYLCRDQYFAANEEPEYEWENFQTSYINCNGSDATHRNATGCVSNAFHQQALERHFAFACKTHALFGIIDPTKFPPLRNGNSAKPGQFKTIMASSVQEQLIHSDENFNVYLFKQTTSAIGFRWQFPDESPLEQPFDLFKVEKCYSCKRNQWDVVHWGTAWSVTVRNLEQNLCYSFRINVLKQDTDDDSFIYVRRSGMFKSFTLPDVPSTTAVFRAVKKSQPELIRKQLSIKPELVNVPVNGETLLYQAVRTGNVEVIDLLLELGANVNLGVPMNGETPLHLAVYNKNIKMVRHLIEHGADLNLTNCVGLTAGHYAVDSNDLQTLKFVLSHGCSAEARDRCSWTLIFRAIFVHASSDVIKYLLEKKCRLKIRDKNHLTPLDYARLTDQPDVIKLLKRRLKI